MNSRAEPDREVGTSRTACVFWVKHDPNALKWCLGQLKVYVENSFFHTETTSRAEPDREVRTSRTACVFWVKHDPNALKWCLGQFEGVC